MNDDDLIHDERLKEYLLEAFPNPERKGCPDEQTLQAAAEDRLPLGDPARRHVASCSECYGEYLNYRQDWIESKQTEEPVVTAPKKGSASVVASVESPRRRSWSPLALAACTALAAALGFTVYKHPHAAPSSITQGAPVVAKVDLFNAITLRGVETEPMPLERVFLPAQVVRLSVTLPRFSRAGDYSILVAKDHAGTQVVAEGHGTAVETAGKVMVNADLDLRAAKPGDYFLATVRGSDNGTYYYPLQVQ